VSEATTEEISETGLSADSIKMVMDHCKCDRKKAVLALKETNGDTVSAILKISS
jgi:nascent polypeptide-associated complex subunit alpha